MPDAAPPRTLLRGFAVLESVAAASGGIGVTEVALATGLDKGTASRLLSALRELGYLRQRAADRQYELGSRSLWLGQRYREGRHLLIEAAGPLIAALRDRTGETVHLAVREGLRMVYLAHEEPDRQIRVQSAVGQRLPLHRTAMGRAILAVLADEDRQALLVLLRREAESSAEPFDPVALEHDVAEARRRGWASIDRQDEVTRVAAAVIDGEGQPMGAITISGPSYRIAERIDELGAEAMRTAAALQQALGG